MTSRILRDLNITTILRILEYLLETRKEMCEFAIFVNMSMLNYVYER